MEIHLLYLLVLLLSINLCIGGGELVGSSIIYVNSTGVDNVTCLNGGPSHPCKTLGYVFINMNKLRCISCTIMINYGHHVFSNHSAIYTNYTINLSSLKYLKVNGNFNCLNFDGSSLYLTNHEDNDTEVIFKNFQLFKCYASQYCIQTDDKYHIKHFGFFNVGFNGNSIGGVDLIANSLTINNCTMNSGTLSFTPFIDGYYCNISDSIFESISLNTRFLISLQIEGLSPLSGDIIISNCTFADVNGSPLSSIPSSMVDILILNNGHSVNITICDSNITGSGHSGKLNFVSVIVNDDTVHATLHLTNNIINDNVFEFGLNLYASNSHKNYLQMVCNLNTFVSNHAGTLMEVYNWPTVKLQNIAIINNTADAYLLHMYTHQYYYYHFYTIISIDITNVTTTGNVITTLTSVHQRAIIYLQASQNDINNNHVTVNNVTFTSNSGTPFALTNIYLIASGNVTFDSNTGTTGGGLYLDNTFLKITENTTIKFTNNSARYGGAIFIDNDQKDCFLDIGYSLALQNNTAPVGSDVFASSSWCRNKLDENCIKLYNMTNVSVISLPNIFQVNGDASVFPGQPIVLDMSVIDCFNKSVPCIADVLLANCADKTCSEYGITLHGLPTVLVHSGPVHTGIAINSAVSLTQSLELQLQFICKTPAQQLPANATATIHLLQCPFGLHLNTLSQQCECDNVRDEFLCSNSVGKACIRKGYWYGTTGTNSKSVTMKCQNLFCNFSSKASICPSEVASNPAGYIALNQLQDDQCLDGHGGTLCTGCTKGKTATYGGLQCIPTHQCRPWHPYALLLLNITCPFFISTILIIVIQLKLNIGSGYLYGPLFYLAVLSLIPFVDWLIMSRIINLFSATFLLKFQVLGFIPWCFFEEVDLLYSTCFELIAPLVVSTVLLLTIYTARCVPRLFRNFQKSPIHAICVLILISFWSLASTSIQVITPVYSSEIKGARVNLRPDLPYFTGVHIPLLIGAVAIILMLFIVTIILVVSPFVNLHRIKPVLDNIQSCYRDNMRWYSGVYFIVWVILQSLILTSSTEIFQTLIIVVTITHCLLQPYSHKWLNITDGFLLACLVITSSLQDYNSNNNYGNGQRKIIVYIATILPLVLIGLGPVLIILVRLGIFTIIKNKIDKYKCKSCLRRPPKQPSTPRPAVTINAYTNIHAYGDLGECYVPEDREPLIHYLQSGAADD